MLEEEKPYYQYLPENIHKKETLKFTAIQTFLQTLIPQNRPDIGSCSIMIEKKRKYDITVPLDDNIRNERTEKITKYIKLAKEIKAIYNLK